MGEHTKHTLLRAVALLSLLLVPVPALLSAQDAGAVSEESAIVQNAEESYPIAASPSSAGAVSTGIRAWDYVRMVIVLVIIIVIIWLFARFFKKNVGGGAVDENPFMLRRVASISLGGGKSVQIVTLLDSKGFLLGVSEEGVSLLGTIDDTELIQALNLNADKAENTARPKNFAEVLELFTRKKGAPSASGEALDFLKQQHDRLGGEQE